MITAIKSVDHLRRQWQNQILANRNPASVAARKRFVVLTFIDPSDGKSVFVNIRRLLVVLLYEDEFYSVETARPNRVPLRLSSYRISRVQNGIQWGGAENSVLHKDLMLIPECHARGQRIDRGKVQLLKVALRLDRRLTRASRYPAAPWLSLRLPRLWAGFQSSDASMLCGVGPEFEQECRRTCVPATEVLRASARSLGKLVLYPLDWVGDGLELATAVFAEVTPSLRRQTCHIGALPDGLIGFQGASAFDFYNSRYRRLAPKNSAFSSGEWHTKLISQVDKDAAEFIQPATCVA